MRSGGTDRVIARCLLAACLVLSLLGLSEGRAQAQSRDALLNGAVIGAGVGAAAGIAFTYAVRDSDLTVSQYTRGALAFGAIGAGVGLGIDALLSRASKPYVTPQRIVIVPSVWRHVAAVAVKWKW